MAVKSNWENGEQFNASDANAVAEAVNAAYVKPSTGVPITDLTASVQVSLGKADTAVQSVTSTSITDSTTTGRAVITAADASAARTTLGVAYGTTAGTVTQGNDSRLTPSSTSITDSTATGRSLITAADPAAARTTLGVAYGSTGGTVAQGNDSRIVGAEQAANKGVANGYASLDGGGKVPVTQLPSSIMQYQGTYNASTNTPSLTNGGSHDTGDVYRVTVAGSRNFGAGSISFEVGDYVIYNGSVFEKSDTTDAVSTVAGLTGDVTASSLRGAIATGTPSSTTWLRGDGAWSTIQASGITRSTSTVTSNTTLGTAQNTDYVTFANITSGDSQYLLTTSLLNANGTNGSTTIVDSGASPLTWTASTGATISTTQKKFGTASLLFNGSADVRAAISSNWTFGTGNFCVEMFIYPTSDAALGIFQQGESYFPGTASNNVGLQTLSSGKFELYAKNAVTQSAFFLWTTNTWYHVAVVRNSGTTTVYVNGQSVINVTGDTTNYTGTYFGVGNMAGNRWSGNIDSIRITRSARYTANFTAPTVEFPGNGNTVTLPSASSTGNNLYTIKNISAAELTVATTSSQTIDGASASTGYAVASNSAARLISDGSNWRTV